MKTEDASPNSRLQEPPCGSPSTAPHKERGLRGHLLRIWSWLDTSAGSGEPEPPDERLDGLRSVSLLSVHLACLAIFWVGISPVAVLVAGLLYLLRMFAITGFYHRYFSHRSYQTSRPMQFLFGALGCSALQRGPLWWAANHRHHHRHSDTAADLHSPVQKGFWHSHILWILQRDHFRTKTKEVPDLMSYPELRFLDRFDLLAPFLLAVLLFLLGWMLERTCPELGTNGWQMLIWGFFVSTVILLHGTCTINSLSHVFGKKRYQTSDESRNNLLLSLITLGEGWHNNHHRYARSTRQGFYWWELDLTYYLLQGMSALGLVWALTPVPSHILEEGRRARP